MNVAIIGSGLKNGFIAKNLNNKGFTPILLENMDDIEAFDGGYGDFSIQYGSVGYKAGFAIITGTREYSNALPDGIRPLPLTDAASFDRCAGYKGPVAVLFDYPLESPQTMTAAALKGSAGLARKKRKVVYLSKSIKTASDGIEDLYRDARNSGVTFVKYDDISIGYNDEECSFKIDAFDGYQKVSFQTACLIAAGKTVPGKNTGKLAEILGLKLDGSGLVEGGRYFLYPGLTGRKGIYNIDFNDENNEVLIKLIISDMISLIGKMTQNNLHAEIDKGKCAFCYTCYRVCPHRAMSPDYENSAMKNLENACFGCGICVSACPAGAIELSQAGGMGYFRNACAPGRLKILCCENSAEIAMKKIPGLYGDKYDFKNIDISSVNCGGEISVENIISALEEYGKVVVAVCMDKACRHFEGNRRALRRTERAKEMLKAAGLDDSRVEYVNVSPAMHGVMKEYISV